MSIFLSLLFSSLEPKYAAEGDLADAVAVIAVPFNSDRPNGPDHSNRAIARIMQGICYDWNLPVFAQREHAVLLRHFPQIEVEEYPTEPGQWVQSHVLVAWFAERLKDSASKRLALVGHQHHVKRVAALCRYYGLEPVIASKVYPGIPTIPYDPYGGQWWCWNPLLYIPWEYASRLALLLLWWRGRLPPRPSP